MPYVNLELVETEEGHVTATDGMGTVHYIPAHIFENCLLENLKSLGIEGIGYSFTIFLSHEYCKINGVFI